MYIVDDKIFIHVVKCGGSAIRSSLVKHRPKDIKFTQEHLSIMDIPSEFLNYETYAILREPLSWYRSFYRYAIQLHKPEENKCFNLLAEQLVYDPVKPVSFEQFLRKALYLEDTITDKNIALMLHKLQKVMPAKPNYFKLIFKDLTNVAFARTLLTGTLYSFFIKSVGALEADNIFILNEDLEDLYGAFKLPTSNRKINKGKVKANTDISIDLYKELLSREAYLYDKFNFKVNKWL